MNEDAIKKIILDVVSFIDPDATISINHKEDEQIVRFLVDTKKPDLLIGAKGSNLSSLSHLVRRILEKEYSGPSEKSHFILDVNNYQEKRLEAIKNKAIILAERAKYFQSSVEMDPMTPYERMVVHAALSGIKNIATESQGEGKNRRVVIRYIESL